jgi:ribosomal protein S12 methylthiotransferase accessory factor
MGSIRRLLDVVDRIVDNRTGIVQSCYEMRPEAHAPHLFHYYAYSCNTAAFAPWGNFRNVGGVATDRQMARAKAVGEAVERYCSAIFRREELPLTSFNAAPFRCVEPERFNYFSAEQFARIGYPYKPFERDTPVRWTSAIDLTDGDDTHVPACAVWMPYYFDAVGGETPIFQPISSGLSAHCSLEEATLGGLLEVVERDSFSMTWQGRLSHPRIRAETLSHANYRLVELIERAGDEVFLLDATTDLGIPCVLVVLHGRASPAPPLTIAASAELSPEFAIRKALEEAVHTRRYMREVQNWTSDFDPGVDFDGVLDQSHHLRLWGKPEMRQQADFLLACDHRVDWTEMTSLEEPTAMQGLRRLVDVLAAKGFRSYMADLTTPDVAALGMHVVRSLVPGLHPFFIGHHIRARNCPRLFEAPQRFGHPAVSKGQDNPFPHPFP